MNTTELRDMFRAEVDDNVAPYLASDSLVYSYIDDAQKMFCRLTEGIEDGRSFKLNIVAAKEWYDLDPAILKFRKAVNAATGREVGMINEELAEGRGVRFDGRAGPLDVLVLGIEKHTARAWPVPNAAATINLYTFRLPETVAAGDDLEIDEQHHARLLLWVKHRFYNIKDSEVRNDDKSAEYEQRFRAYCAQAKAEQGRARRIVGNVVYGGI